MTKRINRNDSWSRKGTLLARKFYLKNKNNGALQYVYFAIPLFKKNYNLLNFLLNKEFLKKPNYIFVR